MKAGEVCQLALRRLCYLRFKNRRTPYSTKVSFIPSSPFEDLFFSKFLNMSGYKTFAIWGSGNLGARIAANLLERKAIVIILTRVVRQIFRDSNVFSHTPQRSL
jgi:hypothetical protein